MNKIDFLDRMVDLMSGSFDITRPVSISGLKYPAYGYFFSLSEKFLVTQKVNLWSARMYEHVLFMHTSKCTEETVREAESLIEGYMEETFVRKGEKYPEKDHMISYITVCILSDETPDSAVLTAVRNYRFEKNYLFTVRGRSEGRLICVDLSREEIVSNRSARQVLSIYKKGFGVR